MVGKPGDNFNAVDLVNDVSKQARKKAMEREGGCPDKLGLYSGKGDRRRGYKAPIASADPDAQRLVGLAEYMRRIGGKQVRTRSETALAVTFFSYSHIAIYSVI